MCRSCCGHFDTRERALGKDTTDWVEGESYVEVEDFVVERTMRRCQYRMTSSGSPGYIHVQEVLEVTKSILLLLLSVVL